MSRQGVSYFVLDDRTHPGNTFEQAINSAQRQGAEVQWRSAIIPGFIPRQAILSTSHTEQPLDDTFDNSVTLVGYSILHDRPDAIGVLLHWQVQRPPTVAYHRFIHLFDPGDGQLVAQDDTELGQGAVPPMTWKAGDQMLEADYVQLPAGHSAECPIRVGLYDLGSGRRAQVVDQSGKALGDGVEFKVLCAGSTS